MTAPNRHQIADGEILVEVTAEPDSLGCVPFTIYRLHTYTPWRVLSERTYGDVDMWTARQIATVRRWNGGAR